MLPPVALEPLVAPMPDEAPDVDWLADDEVSPAPDVLPFIMPDAPVFAGAGVGATAELPLDGDIVVPSAAPLAAPMPEAEPLAPGPVPAQAANTNMHAIGNIRLIMTSPR